MPNACVVSLIKSVYAESLAFKRENERCKNQASGREDSDFFSTSVSVNGGITTVTETS